MPSPSVTVSVYPTGEAVMNLARAFINDSFRGGAGRILTDAASFTIPYLNSAQRKLQDYLAVNGVSSFVKDNYKMLNIPAVVEADASVQCTIDWQGYFNGTQMYKNPILPQDMLVPLDLRERQTGSGQQFKPMKTPQDGLPSRKQTGVFGVWEWRNDKIALIGATMNRDLQLRYEARLPLINTGANLSEAKIMIRDSTDALAWQVAYLFANARGSQQAPMLAANFDSQAAYIVTRYSRRDQRIQYRRKSFARQRGVIGLGSYAGG